MRVCQYCPNTIAPGTRGAVCNPCIRRRRFHDDGFQKIEAIPDFWQQVKAQQAQRDPRQRRTAIELRRGVLTA